MAEPIFNAQLSHSSASERMRQAQIIADELSNRDELAERLRWLIKLRWVALLGVFISIFVASQLQLVASIQPLLCVAAGMAVLNLGFHGLHLRLPERTLRALSAEALLQTAVDVCGLGLLILFSGGLSNPFIFFFTFHVVIAAILLEKRQAYRVAALTLCVVALLALAEQYNLTVHWSLDNAPVDPSGATLDRWGTVFALCVTLMISSYLVTAIMEHLRARGGDVRRLNADLNQRVEMLAFAERKLAAEHERAKAILECMEEGVVVVDLQGKVLLANTAAQKSALLALSDTLTQAGCHIHSPADEGCAGPLAGQNLLTHRHPEKNGAPDAGKDAAALAKDECPMGTPAACLQEALAKGGNLCPATLALLSGTTLSTAQKLPAKQLTPPKSPALAQVELHGHRFENTVSAVKGAGHDIVGLVIVSRDVTERWSLERQVVHAEKLHALGNLAAGLAHELSTPLGTILGYAQMLLDDMQAATKNSNRKEVGIIEEQARRCRKIVQGLLDFARKSSGAREACAPNDLAVRVRDLIAHALELRGIALELDLAEPAPPRINAAANELEQVLVNLITNAADAIEQHEHAIAAAGTAANGWPSAMLRAKQPRLSSQGDEPARVTIQTRLDSSGKILLAVEDNGPGIPAEMAGQIFEPFFTTKSAGRGTGLGLSIARRIVEDHQGTLNLVGRSGGKSGARFEIRLEPTGAAVIPARWK